MSLNQVVNMGYLACTCYRGNFRRHVALLLVYIYTLTHEFRQHLLQDLYSFNIILRRFLKFDYIARSLPML